MTTSPRARPRHLASSPFKPAHIPDVLEYAVDDMISHDVYGVGRVISVEGTMAVTVDFRDKLVRITTPFRQMEPL